MELKISDDGGFITRTNEKGFARGFRLDEQKPGTGLGLNIVKDIVETYMKGGVSLRNQKNWGFGS